MGETDNQIITVHVLSRRGAVDIECWTLYTQEVATNTVEGNEKGFTEKMTFELTRSIYKYFSS